MKRQSPLTPAQRAERLLRDADAFTVPVPVEQVAHHLGLDVRYAEFDDDLSGFIYREVDDGGEEIATVIGVNSKHHVRRKRFTLAHEIAHYTLGHIQSQEFEELHVDRHFACLPRNEKSSQGISPLEIQANGFAAELLMPATLLREDFKKFKTDSILCLDYEDDELAKALAKRYSVSLQAMIIRLTRLGFIEGEAP